MESETLPLRCHPIQGWDVSELRREQQLVTTGGLELVTALCTEGMGFIDAAFFCVAVNFEDGSMIAGPSTMRDAQESVSSIRF